MVIGGKEIVSGEGTTQGDALAMGLSALSIQPLIKSLRAASSVKHYVGLRMIASKAGFIMENRMWWDALTKLAQQEVRTETLEELEHRAEHIKELAPRKTQQALDMAAEKGSSAWLTVLPLQDLSFNLNERESRDAVKLYYDWPVEDIPYTCACGEGFMIDQSMICKLGGFITQRHNELRDLVDGFLSMVCSDVEIKPVLQDISSEHLNRGSNKAQDARLDIHAHGFWECHGLAFFDVRVCHPNAVSCRDLEPQQIYHIHENEKKRLYSRRVLDIEHGTLTPFYTFDLIIL